jgi:hypothetical protein
VFYYDSTHADNSTYVGVTGSTPGKAVWDSNYVMVQHMNDNTTSTILGSTSVNYTGVKKGANEPVEAAGGVGKTQDFDGTDDYVSVADSASLSGLGPITVEAYYKQDVEELAGLVSKHQGTGTPEWSLLISTQLWFAAYNNADNYLLAIGTNDKSDGNYHYAAGIWDGTNAVSHIKVYADGALEALTTNLKVGTGATPHDGSHAVEFGRHYSSSQLDGKISETRISNIARSAAYIKANQYCWTDDLITFGTEQIAGGPMGSLANSLIAVGAI